MGEAGAELGGLFGCRVGRLRSRARPVVIEEADCDNSL
jgi:hypothetical protein